MELAFEILVSALLVIGGLLGLIGSWGLVKLPDLMTRLHAPTKTTTLGVGSVLIASMLWFAFREDHLSFHELLISIFLFLTAPLTAPSEAVSASRVAGAPLMLVIRSPRSMPAR